MKAQPANEFNGPARDGHSVRGSEILRLLARFFAVTELIIGGESPEIPRRVDNLYAESFQLIAILRTERSALVRATSFVGALVEFCRKDIGNLKTAVIHAPDREIKPWL